MQIVPIIILSTVGIAFIMLVFYVRDKVMTNRKFKPIEIKEAEKLVKHLIRKRYGKRKDYMRKFYGDFIEAFPQFSDYNYDYVLHCLNPANQRTNPEMVENALRLLGKPLIVVGSLSHESFVKREK